MVLIMLLYYCCLCSKEKIIANDKTCQNLNKISFLTRIAIILHIHIHFPEIYRNNRQFGI